MGVAQFTAGQILTAAEVNQLPVVVSYLATGSVTNSVAETVIGTFTIPAGDPTFPGGYTWNVHCIGTAVSSPSLTVRLRFGGLAGTVLISGTGSATLATNTFQFTGFMFIESLGTSGTFGEQATVTLAYSGSNVQAVGVGEAIAINTTISNTIVVTAQYGTASASNTATAKAGALYRL